MWCENIFRKSVLLKIFDKLEGDLVRENLFSEPDWHIVDVTGKLKFLRFKHSDVTEHCVVVDM